MEKDMDPISVGKTGTMEKMVSADKSPVAFKWDTKDLEIKTRSVERSLQPLIVQVTTLTDLLSKNKGASRKKKGRSKRAMDLVKDLEQATDVFTRIGTEIGRENAEMEKEIETAVEQVRKTGQVMSEASREFAADPISTLKRGNMIRAGRNLLSAVARLLILADMVDVNRLLKALRLVQQDLERIKGVSSQPELEEAVKTYTNHANDLARLAGRRQQELKDANLRDDLASARAVLKRNSLMLLGACKAYIRHPELAATKVNRDFVLDGLCQAVSTINDVVEGKQSKKNAQTQGQWLKMVGGGFSAALDELDRRIIMDPATFKEARSRPSLEEQLESIISGAALMADSSCTRDDRRDRIVAECNLLRQALQDLLSEYIANAGKKGMSPALDQAVNHMTRKTQDLRRQLRKAVVDHVSDFFHEPVSPLEFMIEAAQAGDPDEVGQRAGLFTAHANKLVEVAHLACSVSNEAENQDGIKMVRYAASQIELLCPQVIQAAKILAARPKSKVAQQNMDNFRQAWLNQLTVLTDAVDDITTIDDFMAVTENHILEDIKKCVAAFQNKDASALDQTAQSVRNRATRFTNVIADDMENYEPGLYTQRVLEAVRELNNQIIPQFGQQVQFAVGTLSSGEDVKESQENDFIDVSCAVYDGVREIRRAVLMNRSDEELDPDEVEVNEADATANSETLADQYPDMCEEDKEKMAQQFQSFQTEKKKFDQEVAKWDDARNDIVSMAKHMCLIMMDMTDFTRGRGRLKTTMDVINSAKKISEAGTKLDKLARLIAEQCPESSTKNDLLAYLQQISFYTHQLNITSKVKADVENENTGLISSQLDGATSLIQSAKNLMNSVVLTVKASYVASTKYPRRDANTAGLNLVWKMKPPEKKPLVRRERPEEIRAVIRRSSTKRHLRPIHVLSQFQGLPDIV